MAICLLWAVDTCRQTINVNISNTKKVRNRHWKSLHGNPHLSDETHESPVQDPGVLCDPDPRVAGRQRGQVEQPEGAHRGQEEAHQEDEQEAGLCIKEALFSSHCQLAKVSSFSYSTTAQKIFIKQLKQF